MIYLKLLFVFLKIGLFSFGGGYAMIPLIQNEIDANGWMSPAEFVDIISIAEMTPGPIAVNSATFVGYKVAGFLGSLSSTIGVSLPSLILILAVSRFFFKYQETPLNAMIFYGVRPVIAGLIGSAAIFVAKTSIFKNGLTVEVFNSVISKPANVLDFWGIIIFVVSFLALAKFRVHPTLIIAGAGIAGILVNTFVPVR